MADPAVVLDQNILPVQALFNVDNTFNTFIGSYRSTPGTVTVLVPEALVDNVG
jgi:hypothetical protein